MRKFWLFSTLILLSACSIYNSAGRKAFEDRAPSQVQTGNLGVAVKDCWTQPANEALWISEMSETLNQQQDQQYKVRAISAEEIEVCLDATNPSQP